MSRVQEEPNTQDLVQGYVALFHHGLCHIKSMAFLCAVQLGIPTSIHRLGGAATISDIVADTSVNPSKLPYLRRLMRVLTVSGMFTTTTAGDQTDTIYKLTPMSRLLVSSDGSSTSCNMSPAVHLMVHPTTTVADFFHLEEWFKDASDTTLFEMTHGMSPWSLTKKDALYNKAVNDASVADSKFTMDMVLKVSVAKSIFCGFRSLVDVGGGHGAAAVAIATAFPHIQCSVLDLEQVVSNAPVDACGTVKFIAGDMFQSVPAADCVLLKFVLNAWDDDSCVKILRQCKRAIPVRDAGGKVIIMNVVVWHGAPDMVTKEAQVMFDVYMMRCLGGEREEHEWKRIFLEAGFSDYKITPTLGFQSIIEVFP